MREKKSWYPHVTIIIHVALYEKSLRKYRKRCYLTPYFAVTLLHII